MVGGDQIFEGDGDRFVKATGVARAKHGALPDAEGLGKAGSLPLAVRGTPIFQQAARLSE
jgi:hypothetical protein